jgi:hypothetical protein
MNPHGGDILKKTSIILLVLAMALTLSVSCNDPESPVKEDDDGIDWPDMASRDDVIETLVLTYMNPKDPESIPKYRALLHSQYFFGLAPQDVPLGGSLIMTRLEDIAATEWIFEYEHLLELTLSPSVGTWISTTEVEGEACAECWQTTREYFIRAQFVDEGTIYTSPPGHVSVSIIVAPDESDPSKWVLRAMYDMYN